MQKRHNSKVNIGLIYCLVSYAIYYRCHRIVHKANLTTNEKNYNSKKSPKKLCTMIYNNIPWTDIVLLSFVSSLLTHYRKDEFVYFSVMII